MTRIKLMILVLGVSLAGNYGMSASAQTGPSTDARDRIEQMRQESEQRMQEMRDRMDSQFADMPSATSSANRQESTMDKMRPYRRMIRWGIGILVVGGIGLWKTMGGSKKQPDGV